MAKKSVFDESALDDDLDEYSTERSEWEPSGAARSHAPAGRAARNACACGRDQPAG